MIKKLICSLLLFATFVAAQVDLDSAAQVYIHNELLFSHTAVVKGRKAAFLEFLSDSSVMFNPMPVNGKELFRSLPERGGYLTWKPLFVEMSAGGDFCYAYGPWEFRKQYLSDGPIGYGHFFSVWEKEGGGWKVILDNGISYKKTALRKETLQILKPKQSSITTISRDASQQSLRDAENLFIAAAFEQTTEEAHRKYDARDIRLLREGAMPITTHSSAKKILSKERERMKIHTFGAKVSPAGDLGFTYGIAVDAKNDSSNYVRVWRKETEWRIAVDIVKRFKQ